MFDYINFMSCHDIPITNLEVIHCTTLRVHQLFASLDQRENLPAGRVGPCRQSINRYTLDLRRHGIMVPLLGTPSCPAGFQGKEL